MNLGTVKKSQQKEDTYNTRRYEDMEMDSIRKVGQGKCRDDDGEGMH